MLNSVAADTVYIGIMHSSLKLVQSTHVVRVSSDIPPLCLPQHRRMATVSHSFEVQMHLKRDVKYFK